MWICQSIISSSFSSFLQLIQSHLEQYWVCLPGGTLHYSSISQVMVIMRVLHWWCHYDVMFCRRQSYRFYEAVNEGFVSIGREVSVCVCVCVCVCVTVPVQLHVRGSQFFYVESWCPTTFWNLLCNRLVSSRYCHEIIVFCWFILINVYCLIGRDGFDWGRGSECCLPHLSL